MRKLRIGTTTYCLAEKCASARRILQEELSTHWAPLHAKDVAVLLRPNRTARPPDEPPGEWPAESPT